MKILLYFRLQGGVWVDPMDEMNTAYNNQERAAEFVKQALMDTYIGNACSPINTCQIEENKTYQIQAEVFTGKVLFARH